MNSINVTGTLGADPVLTFVGANKIGKLSFSVAVYRTKDKTDWLQVEIWGSNYGGTVNNKRPQMYADRLCKGARVGVSGSLQIDKYNDKYYTKINAQNIDMISNLRNTQQFDGVPVKDDDLPF